MAILIRAAPQDGFPGTCPPCLGLCLGLQARGQGPPVLGERSPGLRVGTQTQEESTGLQALIHPHPGVPGEAGVGPQGERRGGW